MSESPSSSKTSLSQLPLSSSPQLPQRTMTSSNYPPSHAFTNRRGNIKFSSGRLAAASRNPSRARKGNILSFRSSRRTAPRPTRTRGVFESLLASLTDGIEAVRGCVSQMKSNLPTDAAPGSRTNYYMDAERQIKLLERKIRTLDVHKDRIEEMRDEYLLKLKLRDGAFNLAQALANQSSKAAREKLQEARAEQRDLLEDLCDIEDELETKLGVFKVHINGLVGLGRMTGDTFEAQLKLGTQKWKARCKITRQQQIWQDADIIFLGKVADELFVKVVEMKRIQGNAHVGSMKCQTRELFSFYPLNVTYNFTSSSVKLSMDVRWSPVIGDDFLSDLDLHTIHCLVGGRGSKLVSRPSSLGNVERLHLYPNEPFITGLNSDTTVHQIRIITEPEGDESRSSNSYDRIEVKTESVSRKKSPSRAKKHKTKDSDFVFVDRHSVMLLNEAEIRDLPEAKELLKQNSPEASPVPEKHVPKPRRDSYSSLGSSSQSSESYPPWRNKSPEVLTLVGTLEAVLSGLDEPKDLYPELRRLECQLARLEAVLKGGKLTRTPSMTLSEGEAMDSFEFLGSDDALLMPRFSRASFVEVQEDILSHSSSHGTSSPQKAPYSHTLHEGGEYHQSSIDSQSDDVFSSGYHDGTGTTMSSTGNIGEDAGTGVPSVDRVLVQHLIHCEVLLQHLQSAGPLNCKLNSGLRQLQQEAEIIAELLNIAADPSTPPKIESIIPELAASEQLMKFWKTLAKDNVLSVSYEQFAVGLDEKFGQSLWNDFPEVANKVFTELLGRILDLDVEEYGPGDTKMVITVFHYATFFLSQGSGILKCMREVAQELQIMEGLNCQDKDVRSAVASQLLECGYNQGALLASAVLLADPNTSLQSTAVKYVESFAGNSPWHSKAVQFFVELLEHTDQEIRIGACTALGILEAKSAIRQLKYLAKGDFTPVRSAACKALVTLGEPDPSTSGDGPERSNQIYKKPSTKSLTPQPVKKKSLQRTRSADTSLNSDHTITHL